MKMAGIDRKVSVLNTTVEGHKVILTEVLTEDKKGGEKLNWSLQKISYRLITLP